MVEIKADAPVAPSRTRLSRFTPWVNKLEVKDEDKLKVVEVRKNVVKVDWKENEAVNKHFDCRVQQSNFAVTKGYAARRSKNHIFDAFGIGSGEEAIRGNAHITMLHRDNVWHPHFEVMTEQEDLGTRMRQKQNERKEGQTEGAEILELKANLENLEKIAKEDADAKNLSAIGAPKRKIFDARAIQAKSKALEESEGVKQILDPTGVRLTDLPQMVTEGDLLVDVVAKFGPVERIYMPMDQMRPNNNRGLAIINFKRQEDAAKAIAEGEINIGFAAVSIAQSFRSQRRNNNGGGGMSEFDQLKRRQF